jgi:fucose 4-O-acetylase-like acetyltransferase
MTLDQGTSAAAPPDAIGRDRLASLDALRGVAIALVVGVHAAAYSDVDAHAWGPFIRAVVETIGVPAFFLADGYLLAVRGRPLSYTQRLRESARRLLLPWLVFSALYGVAQAAFEAAGLSARPLLADRSVPEILLLAYTAAFARQLYFLPALFMIRLASGGWRRLAEGPAWGAWLLWLGYAIAYRNGLGAAYVERVPLPGLDPGAHALWGLQFFLLGIALAGWRGTRPSARPVALACTAAAAATGALDPRHAAFQYSYLLAAFAASVWLAPRLPRLAVLGRQTMGVYLLHTPVLLKLAALATAAVFSSLMARFVANWAIALLGALALSLAISGTPLGRLLFGERRASPQEARR